LTDPERISTHVSAFALNVSLTPLAIRVASAAVASPVVISGAVVVSGAVEIAG
jgi:heme/copper-type cytochrome/quinol oxidase subunit 4